MEKQASWLFFGVAAVRGRITCPDLPDLPMTMRTSWAVVTPAVV